MRDIVRPDPLRWLAYAFGAGLPERHRTWVLHDVTARTWVLRHMSRALLQIVPIGLLLYLLLPLDPLIVLGSVGLGTAMGLIYAGAFTWGAAEHRAMKAGYPQAYAEAVRARRARGESLDDAIRATTPETR